MTIFKNSTFLSGPLKVSFGMPVGNPTFKTLRFVYVKRHFFSKKPNDHDSIWTGDLRDSKEISKTYKFDRCDYLDSLERKLIDYLKRTKSVYHSLVKNSFSANVFDACILDIEKGYRKGVEIPSNLYSMKKIIHQLRLIKNEDENKERGRPGRYGSN